MRLWHIELIQYLPNSQLIAQWRELNSIFKKQDNHILINYIYDYSKYELRAYSDVVRSELRRRCYNINDNNYFDYFESLGVDFNNYYTPRFREHNDEYLTICYWNLREKYIRGQKGFTDEIWNKLDKFYKNKIKEEL